MNSRTAKKKSLTVVLYTMNFMKTNSICNKRKEMNYCKEAQAVITHVAEYNIYIQCYQRNRYQLFYYSHAFIPF